MIKEVLYLMAIVLGIPAGYLIAWMTRDELVAGRKWFKIVIGAFALTGIVFLIKNNLPIVLTSLFAIVVSFISLIKSRDKKWCRI